MVNETIIKTVPGWKGVSFTPEQGKACADFALNYCQQHYPELMVKYTEAKGICETTFTVSIFLCILMIILIVYMFRTYNLFKTMKEEKGGGNKV